MRYRDALFVDHTTPKEESMSSTMAVIPVMNPSKDNEKEIYDNTLAFLEFPWFSYRALATAMQIQI
jgi:hypothetical protein